MQQCCNNLQVKTACETDFKTIKQRFLIYDVLKLVLLKQVIKEVEGKDIILL